VKLCAEAANGVPQSATANNAGMRKRNEGIGKSLCGGVPGNSAEGRLLEDISVRGDQVLGLNRVGL
jgi:hypothetical protein